MADSPTRSAAIWSGALQAAATMIGHFKGSAPWGTTPAQQDTATAARIVQLAAHLIVAMPDDPDSGVHQAKIAAQQFLKKPPA
jgi:hypothetical protein